MIRSSVICAAMLAATSGMASDAWTVFDLPSGQPPLSERTSAMGSYELPTGPFANGTVPTRQVEGEILRRSWRLKADDKTTLQILDPLRSKIADAGYDILFECAQNRCGGFDFRFGIEIIPAPDMGVDIGDYRFLSAVHGAQALTLLVSRSGQSGYVQVIQVRPVSSGWTTGQAMADTAVRPVARDDGTGALPAETAAETADFTTKLATLGHAALPDLEFRAGSAKLGPGSVATLERLSEFLTSNGAVRIALVGHTDNVGSLDDNIVLSRQRAQAVRQRLLDQFNIQADRVQSDGVGYLAPLVSNDTPEGRDTNRRVEVVLLSP